MSNQLTNLLPEFVDPMRLAETRQTLKGQVAVAAMPRLMAALDMLPRARGQVDVVLAFSVDRQGVRRVLGSLHAELDALCQRCLQPMVLPLHVNIALGIVRALDEAEQLPGEYEPLVLASVTEGLPLASIIEDELLLALPVAPLHEEARCPVRSAVLDNTAMLGAVIAEDLPPEGKKRPFAGLAVAFGVPAAHDTDTSCVAQLQQLKKKS